MAQNLISSLPLQSYDQNYLVPKKTHINVLSIIVNIKQRTAKKHRYKLLQLPANTWQNHCEQVQHLCKHNRPGVLNYPDEKGHTALYKAVWNGCLGCVETLICAGADGSVVDGSGDTPLMLAAKLAYVQVARKLLLAHDMSINHKNFRGETALSLAASSSYVQCVEVLLSHGADPNVVDNHNCTPLFSCIYKNRAPTALVTISLLIKHNADLNIKGKEDGVCRGEWMTPFELAVHLERHSVVELLFLSGCDLGAMRGWVRDHNVPDSLKQNLTLYNLLKDKSSSPPSLKQTCRKLIRTHCLVNDVYDLCLPKNLLDYISFNDLRLCKH